MNSWGFMPELVGELERLFTGFLEEHGTELKSEFYLPFAVDTLIREGRAEIKMLKSEDSWFGITYREDKPFVQAALRKLVAEGLPRRPIRRPISGRSAPGSQSTEISSSRFRSGPVTSTTRSR